MAATETAGAGVRWSLDGLFASAADARAHAERALEDAKGLRGALERTPGRARRRRARRGPGRARRPARRAPGGRELPLPRREHRLGERRDQGSGRLARATPDGDRQRHPRASSSSGSGCRPRRPSGCSPRPRWRRGARAEQAPPFRSRTRCRSPKSGCSTSATRRRSRPGRRSSTGIVSTLAVDFDSGTRLGAAHGLPAHVVPRLPGPGPAPASQRGAARTGRCRSSRSWRSATTRSSPTGCCSTGSGAIRSRCCRRISRTSWRPVRCWRCSTRSRPRTRSRSGGCA